MMDLRTLAPTPMENVFVVDMTTGELLATHNTVTETHKNQYAQFLTGSSITAPDFIGLGYTAPLATETPREFTDLKAEFVRIQADSRIVLGTVTARYLAIFTTGTGTGTIREFGLFSAAESTTVVHAMDATAGWTSAGTVSLESADYIEGTAAVEAATTGNGAAQNVLVNTGLSINATAHTTASYLQFWYFIDTATFLTGGNFDIRLYTGGTDHYQWTPAQTTVVNGWNFFNLRLSDATTSGSPDIATTNISEFHVISTKDNLQAAVERVDHIRMWKTNGNLWAYAEPTSAVTKSLAQVIGVYWFISTNEGGAEVAFKSFDEEPVTITTSVVSLTAATYSPTGEEGAKRAHFVVTGAPIRYWTTGRNPTSTEGILAPIGSTFLIDDVSDIGNFRAIRDDSAEQNATIYVTYER